MYRAATKHRIKSLNMYMELTIKFRSIVMQGKRKSCECNARIFFFIFYFSSYCVLKFLHFLSYYFYMSKNSNLVGNISFPVLVFKSFPYSTFPRYIVATTMCRLAKFFWFITHSLALNFFKISIKQYAVTDCQCNSLSFLQNHPLNGLFKRISFSIEPFSEAGILKKRNFKRKTYLITELILEKIWI